ncbi:Maf family protein [Pelagicoccus sp. SDUM812002]|uniref:Maf family protein n=1 Tax=Pelagicoccus sp. SDUM812002 TaxID=3041266 RepID=UPI00281066F2|nr:Maf family protein [Pelagicoccus sp. SDUM812002]MDQ8185195.1 Maf family protein [Pelagicoccus sp. SDUM812002]
MSLPKFILASQSPRRRDLLDRIGATFEVMPADVEEFEEGHGDPEGMVRHNAQLKAAFIADQHPSRFVLGSDTTVHIDGRVLVKPEDLDDARRMLKKLGGRTHIVYTGFALICREKKVEVVDGARSEVTFKPLDDAIIDEYFSMVNPLDKAGAYGIQEGTGLIIDSFVGSHSNIMGLPLDETKALLERHNLL